jgi:hypothetical protein
VVVVLIEAEVVLEPVLLPVAVPPPGVDVELVLAVVLAPVLDESLPPVAAEVLPPPRSLPGLEAHAATATSASVRRTGDREAKGSRGRDFMDGAALKEVDAASSEREADGARLAPRAWMGEQRDARSPLTHSGEPPQ